MHLAIQYVSHPYLTFVGFHHFTVYFLISLFISSYANALGHLVYLTLIFNPSSIHNFITYILGSLTFECMLDLWVYTYKPWGFIHSSLSDSYISVIMSYKTYVSCVYVKILILI